MFKFVYGPSGSGKSHYIQEEIIKRSIDNPNKNYLIIVPDQFTMQTQMDIVKMHPRHGIMNIDVLSFSRLSHRIFEEISVETGSVLDDMGKSLVLRHVAEDIKDKLPIIGSNMHKMGYVDEVKSTISEFMQYCIEPDDLDKLKEISKGRGALCAKLSDLQLLYSEFKSYIKDNYIAQEELLNILCRILPDSKLIAGSTIAFDGFTGFTPVQYQVIKQLLKLSEEVVFSCTLGDDENLYEYRKESEQDLFLLSKKTVHDLLRLEYDNEKEVNASNMPDFDRWAYYRKENNSDIRIISSEKSRHSGNPELAFLEQNLFRYSNKSYDGDCRSIAILEADTVQEEVLMAFSKVRELIRQDPTLHYRDFAIVCGSLDRYEPIISRQADKTGLPVYIDQTGAIKLNPLIELIRSALKVVYERYTYESVFHYLRSGLSDFSREEADKLENYVRSLGIRGKKNWEQPFSQYPKYIKRKLELKDDRQSQEEAAEYLEEINEMRLRLVNSLAPLFECEGKTVRDISVSLYAFLEENRVEEKLAVMEQEFRDENDEIRAKEYGIIFSKVINLLDQVTGLLGNEPIELKEYSDILDVGFSDIEIGTIPQSVDKIVVGDIERTRLKEVKILLLLGVTDDLIPKNATGGGIISDIERQFLIDSGTDLELAPSPRQQMYTQRLYLYMNLTKPSDKLFMSFAHLDSEGKSIRPAYLIGKIRTLFPSVVVEKADPSKLIQTTENGIDYIASNIQNYALGYMQKEEEQEFCALFHVINEAGGKSRQRLARMLEAAGMNYHHKPLTDAVASMLYGNTLVNSVSRLEKFAECSYAHFLRYGLGISEREEFSFSRSDLGNVFHGVLKDFSENLKKENLDWFSFSPEQGERILNYTLDDYAKEYSGNILGSSMRNEYALERIRRILLRSVDTLQYQLSKGSFVPKSMETAFDSVGNIDAINIDLTEDEKSSIRKKMRLTGSIDRIDTYDDGSHVYVKIIDFKSGSKNFDLCALYYGLQLQLVMYMNVARGMEEAVNPGKEVIPAAILYYHIDDPVLKGSDVDKEKEDVDINKLIRKELNNKGIVREDKEVVRMIDKDIVDKSDVIPVALSSKTGEFSKQGNSTMTGEDFDFVSEYVTRLIRKEGRQIVSGDINVNPCTLGDRDACKYCKFRSICGYDENIPGFSKTELKKLDDSQIIEEIKRECI
ncbi:PD-(D/E)XK nuclease family protein [Butyrivibrio sp. NC2002]|uniref:PD-(D/E)XK nuclease family protein n=1 Tax=Butyrivibrio sp. NC2002 TaxID=1410610 RepID=UPI000565ED03|nr:PD-(D/E)XK nuclease family protein [Butyrivibrio sp. NC2002]